MRCQKEHPLKSKERYDEKENPIFDCSAIRIVSFPCFCRTDGGKGTD